MEEMEASSVAKTVACESNRLNPPQSAINNPLFSQAGLPNSLQPPGKPSVPPSHEHSDWMYLRRCGLVRTGNRSGTVLLGCERSSVCEVYRIRSYICRRLTPKKISPARTFVHLYIRIFAIFCARDGVLSVLGRKGCSPPHIPRFVPMVVMS